MEKNNTVSEVYENWFLEYASYVILERAVPAAEDGLKPVQRRILHAMKEMDDGRYHKVANVIGQAMQFHPHGDASIGEALVNLGQKDLLIDCQGNWGDINTGDSAAAPRYIESRLTPFALEVVFNPQTTEWQLSYDGRKKEPVTLPVKFPLLLAQGAEGIAVGLATKVMPHNFNELIEASIAILQKQETNILPDFPTGGLADFTNYNGGQRGGKIKVRSRIEKVDKKTLIIRDLPYGVTTSNLIDSILKANDAGKLKIKQVIDNTTDKVEILIKVGTGIDLDITKQALYAFSNCEVSISPNTCVIIEEKPHFVNVNDLLKVSTEQTKDLLRQELEIRKSELLEKILYNSLEKIFIENRIYRDIEEAETWEAVLETIDAGLEPYKQDFYREITQEDIIRLTEIRIKRISKYDSFKADEATKKLGEELTQVEKNLKYLTRYAVSYFKNLLKKYGKGKERKTRITTFSKVDATQVIQNNQKLYVDRKNGFIGYGLKKSDAEFVSECSDLDEILVFRQDGKYIISKISDKVFVGQNILFVVVFNKESQKNIYNMVYKDGKTGYSFAKRFQIESGSRDKEYDMTRKNPDSEVLYFSVSNKKRGEIITIELVTGFTKQAKVFEYNFNTADIVSKTSIGKRITKYEVKSIETSPKSALSVEDFFIWHKNGVAGE